MHRKQLHVIAITGSAGKTTTKEMIASILKSRWKILKSPYNYNFHNHNRHILKKLDSSHRAAVLEFGMSKHGHIRKHCLVIRPNIAVVTNVGTAHIGNFGGDVKELACAKSELIQYMKPNGILLLNADDKNSSLMPMHGFKGKIIRVGINNPQADYSAYDIHYGKGGMVFKCRLHNHEHSFFIPIYGTHNVYNALFAIAIADHLKFNPDRIKTGLRTYFRIGGRLRIYMAGKGVRIIDDSYSANPHATKEALKVLHHIGGKNKIAVLGTMKCMGNYSGIAHKSVGQFLSGQDVQQLFTYGKDADLIREGAIETGFPAENARHFTNQKSLIRSVAEAIKPGTTVLVKGSNEMGMGKVVRRLRSSPRIK